MTGRQITGAVIGIAAILVGLYDLIAFAIWGSPATISSYLLGLGTIAPTVPFVAGFVLGHLFWPQRAKVPTRIEVPKP